MSPRRARAWTILLASAALFAAAPVSSNARSPQAAPQADAAKAAVLQRLNKVRTGLLSGTVRADQAIAELKAILADEPKSAEGHLLLGMAYRLSASPELVGEAVAELRQALTIDPAFVPARYYLAQIYLDLGRAARAREELDEALAQVPGNPQLLALLGEAERQQGNPQRSVELNRQALKGNDSFAQARFYLALALFDLNQRREAVKELEAVVQSGPKVVEPYLSLGIAYLEAGRADAALTVLAQASRIDASRPEVRIQTARAYRIKGLLARAEEQLTLAASKVEGSVASPFVQLQQIETDLHLERGLLKLQQKQLDAAAAAFQNVLESDAGNGPANRYLAEIYLRQGSYARAREHAARAEKAGMPLPEKDRALLQEKLGRKPAKGLP